MSNIVEGMNFDETGFSYSMSLISGKYKLPILDQLCDWGEENRAEL